MTTVAQEIGEELYTACAQNDVVRVETSTSRAIITDWSKVLIAAASEGATDVVTHCMEQANELDIIDEVLKWVIYSEDSEYVYHFLVESNFVSVDYFIKRWGTMLGIAAGTGKADRHSLVRYLLEKGAHPNHPVQTQGHKSTLACAAGYSDAEMVKLLLDHGARLEGGGALVLAAQKGRLENLQFLLARGADVNEMGIATFDKRTLKTLGTPLHKAIENRQVAVVDVLLQAGADLALPDAQGRTAEDIAAEKGMDTSILEKMKPSR